ncbi:MAG: uroporphyrinogen decarboxylase family protein [Bacillota bacterium]
MKARERVLLALNHREPDRVPLDIGSTANNFTLELFNKLKDYFKITFPDFVPRPDESAPYYNDELIQKLGGDFMHVFIFPSKQHDYSPDSNGITTNEWGIPKKLVNGMRQQVASPLADAESIDDILKYNWPDPDEEARYKGIRERAKMLYNETDFAIAARAVSHGIFELSWELRGMENFFVDLALEDDKAIVLLDKITELQIRMYENYLKECGEFVHVVQTADDYGTQNGPMMSLEMWRKYIKPRRKKINDTIKKYAPNAKIFLHTCGSVVSFIDDLIEIGVEILNPVQPYAEGMESSNLKKRFGDRICFHGGIDEQRALPVSKEAIDKELRERINALAKGGGYIIGPTSNIQNDTPVDHVLYYIEKAKEYGKYPISI